MRPELIAADPILKYFSFGHLREGLIRDTSELFAKLAETVADSVERSPERTVAFRKLLEAKDAAVRCAVDMIIK